MQILQESLAASMAVDDEEDNDEMETNTEPQLGSDTVSAHMKHIGYLYLCEWTRTKTIILISFITLVKFHRVLFGRLTE